MQQQMPLTEDIHVCTWAIKLPRIWKTLPTLIESRHAECSSKALSIYMVRLVSWGVVACQCRVLHIDNFLSPLNCWSITGSGEHVFQSNDLDSRRWKLHYPALPLLRHSLYPRVPVPRACKSELFQASGSLWIIVVTYSNGLEMALQLLV